MEPLSLAAAAAGADGVIVEVHPCPEEAVCDGPQALYSDTFADYLRKLEAAAELAGKGRCAPGRAGCEGSQSSAWG